MIFPADLEARLRIQLGDEFGRFHEVCTKPTKKSLRVNTLKAEVDEITEAFELDPIPWCGEGYYTVEDVSSSIQHYQGLCYIQEAASMLAAEILKPKGEDVVLDLTAAPGSKTTQVAALMENRGCIVANDINQKRLKSLRFNLNRMGVANALVTRNDGRRLKPRIEFDKILLDAPCSNTGQLRDNPEALSNWSIAKVKRCSNLQKKLMDTACRLLKREGVLVYSTCTFSPEENEEVVDHAIKRHDMSVESISGDFNARDGMSEWEGKRYHPEVEFTTRIYPHSNDTGGFYTAKLRK